MAIVSNKPDPTTKALAEKFFPGVLAFGQRDDLPPKPAPDLVLCALKELGLPRESAIYVGDSEVDIQTAWNCRMNYIGVSWGFRGRGEAAGRSAPGYRGRQSRGNFAGEKFATCPLTSREKVLIICCNQENALTEKRSPARRQREARPG